MCVPTSLRSTDTPGTSAAAACATCRTIRTLVRAARRARSRTRTRSSSARRDQATATWSPWSCVLHEQHRRGRYAFARGHERHIRVVDLRCRRAADLADRFEDEVEPVHVRLAHPAA